MQKPFTDERPWGAFRQFCHNDNVTVKTLTVKPGAQLSLQYHKKRTEFWHVLAGDPLITIGRKDTQATAGDEFIIECGDIHRITGGAQTAVLLEISYGDFDEADIIRVDDIYGRS